MSSNLSSARCYTGVVSRAFWYRSVLLGLMAMFLPHLSHAAVIHGETSDGEVQSGAVVSSTATTMLVGGSGSPVLDRSAVFVFKLPNLGAVANPFTNAIFRFELASKSGTPPNADLYGLGSRASATVLAGDYYGQTSTADPSDATLLQNNLLISTTANGTISTNSATSTALKNYLNAQYAAGAGAGKYVFLRLSSDSVSTTTKRYTVNSANHAASGGTCILLPVVEETAAFFVASEA